MKTRQLFTRSFSSTPGLHVIPRADGALNIDVSAIRMTGINRKSFTITDFPTEDFMLLPGQSRVFTVTFVARAGEPGKPYTVVQLRGVTISAGSTPSSYRPSGAGSTNRSSLVRDRMGEDESFRKDSDTLVL